MPVRGRLRRSIGAVSALALATVALIAGGVPPAVAAARLTTAWRHGGRARRGPRGVSFSGLYNTIGGQILQSIVGTASTITYQFALAAGQSLAPGSGRLQAAQMGGSGTPHPTSGDTFTITYTSGGASFTQSGHF